MSEIFVSLLYLLLSVCIIYPPTEFISAGITIPNIFSSYLGSEYEQFIQYHIKRSCITLLVYSFIPVGYIIWMLLLTSENKDLYTLLINHSYVWQLFLATALVLPLLALYQIINWCRNNYEDHPITKSIKKYCNNNLDWDNVASDINLEYRRIDKICIHTSAICQIVVTENWIIKILPLSILFTHQTDASLVIQNCDRHNISRNDEGEVQYLNIMVSSSRTHVESFLIRLNSADFQDLQDRVARSITIPSNINFHKTIIEKFVETFKTFVLENPIYRAEEPVEQCIGCMQNTNFVKLQKKCNDEQNNTNNCSNCYCRPMWCIECMAKWFASRQNNNETNTWLSSKCTCPMCRATFCLLDVCMVEFNVT